MAARRGTLGGPRHGPVERPVHLEHARPVAEALGSPPTARRQAGRRRSRGADAASRRAGPRAPAGDRRATRRAGRSRARRPGLELRHERGRHARPPRRGSSASRPRARRSRGPARRRHSPGDRGGAWNAPRSRRTARAPPRRRSVPAPAPPSSGARAGRSASAQADGEERGRPGGGSPRRACERRGRAARKPEARHAHRPHRVRSRWRPGIARGQPHARRRAGGRPARPGGRRSTPCAARSIDSKKGEATVSGRIVEHTSWRKPGRVSSAVRVPPPAVAAAS